MAIVPKRREVIQRIVWVRALVLGDVVVKVGGIKERAEGFEGLQYNTLEEDYNMWGSFALN